MESIGEKLKQTRERKGLQLEQVTRETNIARRYLAALEEEDFQAFPGEPYLLGFLRNYAEYLGLDAQELVGAYRNIRIQEQPVPVRELLEHRRPPHPLAVIAGIAALLAVAALVVVIVLFSGRGGDGGSDIALTERASEEYRLESSPFEKRLYPGDALYYELRGETYRISLESISDAVILKAPFGTLRLSMGEEVGLDLDSDNSSEIRASLNDFVKGKPASGALVRLEFDSPASALADGALADEALAGSALASGSPLPGASPAASADTSKGQVLIEARTSPYPFTLSVSFRQYCMFRHEVDKKDRTERYYRKGEQITANANNGIKVWASNAMACTAQVIAGGKTVTVDLGKPGEVTVKDIKWVQVDSGWALTALPVD